MLKILIYQAARMRELFFQQFHRRFGVFDLDNQLVIVGILQLNNDAIFFSENIPKRRFTFFTIRTCFKNKGNICTQKS